MRSERPPPPAEAHPAAALVPSSSRHISPAGATVSPPPASWPRGGTPCLHPMRKPGRGAVAVLDAKRMERQRPPVPHGARIQRPRGTVLALHGGPKHSTDGTAGSVKPAIGASTSILRQGRQGRMHR